MTFDVSVFDHRTSVLLSVDRAEFGAIPEWGDALFIAQLGDCRIQERQVDWQARLVSLYVVPKAEWSL